MTYIRLNPLFMKASALKGLAFLILLFSTNLCFSQNQVKRIVYQYAYNSKDSVNKKTKLKLVDISYQDYNEKTTVANIYMDSLRTSFNGNYSYEYSYGKHVTTIKKFSIKDDSLLQVIQNCYGVNNRLLLECSTDAKSRSKFEDHYLYDRNQRVAKILQYKNGKLTGCIIYEYPDALKTESAKKTYTNS